LALFILSAITEKNKENKYATNTTIATTHHSNALWNALEEVIVFLQVDGFLSAKLANN
jgi:D-arabinose 5-phosphate isomerase GutQ